MMPMMWMLMAQTIMSAITTACFSLSSWRRRTGSLKSKTTRDRGATARGQRGHRQRQVHQATPSPWVPRECPLACLVVVQALGVSHQHRLRRLGFAVPLPRHKDRLSKVQGVQEVAGAQVAPVVKKLHQRDVVTTPDIPLPALARGRAALTLEKCGLAPPGEARACRTDELDQEERHEQEYKDYNYKDYTEQTTTTAPF